MNALTSKKIKKKSSQLSFKKNIILFLFLSLLVDDYFLMYLEITILYIYNFTILHRCLFGFFFFFLASPSLKSWICPCLYSYRLVVGKCNEWVTKPNFHGKAPLAKFVIHCTFVRNLAKPMD